MSSQNQESHSAEDRAPELELNKETLQDLDLEPIDANEVKGGAVSAPASTGRYTTAGGTRGVAGVDTGTGTVGWAPASIVTHP
jgi:hypothetical protein